MNKEEIEELKDFTIDLTDIDELALGLEVCSKKSNMVIQEFADTIIQLQQENQKYKEENQELKKQLKESKDNYNCLLKQKEQFEYIMSKQVDYQGQQKEFIEWLEAMNRMYQNEYKDIDAAEHYNCVLQKYKSIIGDDIGLEKPNKTNLGKFGIKNKKARKIKQIDINTNEIINVFYGVCEAGRKTGINYRNIDLCLKNKRNYAGGYKWELC